jgi:serine/threonine protein kinase
MQPAPVPKAKPLHVHKPLVLKPSVEATYLFERLINEGSTACVYEARSRYTEQAVAVKEVRRTSATTAVVLNERDMLTGLDHPNIARLLDFDETSTSYFIVQVRRLIMLHWRFFIRWLWSMD